MEIKKCEDCACLKQLYYKVLYKYIPTEKWCCVKEVKENPTPKQKACEKPVEKGSIMDPEIFYLQLGDFRSK